MTTNKTNEPLPVLVFLGDGGVGKTSLIIRYKRNTFVENYDPTLAENHNASIKLDDKTIDVSIADTAGQDEYKSLRDHYIDKGDVFIIVFSLTEMRTLTKAKETLIEIKMMKEENFKLILVGNKCDIPNRQIAYDDGSALAKEFNGIFIEASAKKDVNVELIFKTAANLLVNENIEEANCTCLLI